MNWLTKMSIKNKVAVLILCVLVLIAGFYSTKKIQLETMPDVTFPMLIVQATAPNQSAEDIERDVTKPLEQVLLAMKDYDTISGTSSENMSSLMITYPFGTDIAATETKLNDTLSKLKLPDDVKVSVNKLSGQSLPVWKTAFSGDDLTRLQADLEQDLVPALEQVDGVSAVNLIGTRTSDLLIEVDEAKAQAKGITLIAIKDAVQAKQYTLPLGAVSEQSGTTIPVRLTGSLGSLDELKNLTLTTTSGGTGLPKNAYLPYTAPVKLSDIATVKQVTAQQEISRYNGDDALVVEVQKDASANTVSVVNRIKEIVAKQQQTHDYTLHTILDQGHEVEKSVDSLVREGGLGALFTVIVILLFLRNLRATIISILSLPLSIFGTIALLHQMGFTLNIMTLGGMAVAVGRIVDDSIVVIENIYRWRQEKGDTLSGKQIAYRATREVMRAVAASTIVTLVVFLPLAFVTGIIGEFFRPFALAVVFAISLSLLVAIILIPMLGSFLFKKVRHEEQVGKITRAYEKLLRVSLKRKGWVLALSIVLLIASLGLIPVIGVAFLPAGEAATLSVDVTLPPATEMAKTDEMSKGVEQYLQDLPESELTQVSIGFSTQGMGFGRAKVNVAHYTVNFKEGTDIDKMADQLKQDITKLVQPTYPDVQVSTRSSSGGGGGNMSGNNVAIKLYSSDYDKLSQAATQVEDMMKQNDDLKDVSNNLNDKQPKWVLTMKEPTEGQKMTSPYVLMQAVNEHLAPVKLGTYEFDQKEWNLTLGYDTKVTTREQFADLTIMTPTGAHKLGDLADIRQVETPVTIRHDNGKTYAEVSATIKGQDTARITQNVMQDLDALTLPSGVTHETGGGLQMINDGLTSLGLAILAAIFLVFLILSVTFSGVLTPLVVLSSLLFVPIGAITGLLVSGQALSMSSMIGLLMLVGIVVTNAVVLLDRVETNRKNGVELTEAIVEAAKTRLRPIVMTACATVFALIPLALSNNTDTLISKGLAVTVIGGLTTSTLLTLIVVPVLYRMVGNKRRIETEEL
ncbi:MAG TPA: efflux RND transporter permease subunit [Bacilli bacterium]|nr:efflux RND transporter permease subunit [Bacilli bacterium]